MIDAKTEAQRLLDSLIGTANDLRGIHGGLAGVKNAAKKIVPRIEELGKKLKLSNEDKKAIAVEALLIVLRRYGGKYLNWVPEFILRWLIGLAIEEAVRLMKGSKDGGKT